jgi:hypothetical protein
MLGILCFALSVVRSPLGPRMVPYGSGSRAAAASRRPRLVSFFNNEQSQLWPASDDLVSVHMKRDVVYLEVMRAALASGSGTVVAVTLSPPPVLCV